MPCCSIANDFVRNAVLSKLPGGQARPLQARASLIDQNLDPLSLLVRHADYPQGRAPINRSQRSSVAMMQNRITIFNQGSTNLSHAQVGTHVLVGNELGFINQHLLQFSRRSEE